MLSGAGRIQIVLLLAVPVLLVAAFALTTNAASVPGGNDQREERETTVRFSGTVSAISGGLLTIEGAAGAINGEFPDGSIEVRISSGTDILFMGRARYESAIIPGAHVRVTGSYSKGALAVAATEVVVDVPGEEISHSIVIEEVQPSEEAPLGTEESPVEPIPAAIEEPAAPEPEPAEPPVAEPAAPIEEPAAVSTEPALEEPVGTSTETGDAEPVPPSPLPEDQPEPEVAPEPHE